MGLSIISGLLFLLFLLFITGLIIIIATRSSNKYSAETNIEPNIQKRGATMIRTIYKYLILFATLMMTIGGSVGVFMAVADLVSPPAYYQSFEEFKRMPKGIEGKPGSAPAVSESEEELKKNYEQLVRDEKERARARALNSLIKSFGWIVIPLPVFLYFQRKLKDN